MNKPKEMSYCWKCKRNKELIGKVDILHNHKWICFHCFHNLRFENRKLIESLRGRIKYLERKQESRDLTENHLLLEQKEMKKEKKIIGRSRIRMSSLDYLRGESEDTVKRETGLRR